MGVDPNGVTYTVKDLLDRMDGKLDKQDGKLDGIMRSLDQKADRDRVHALENRLHAFDIHRELMSETILDFKQVQKDVADLLAWQMKMSHVVETQADHDEDIEDLQAWRNRLIGAAGLASAVGITALAGVLFQLFHG